MVSKRQRYHLEPPTGLLNDPNGLSWFDGKYRIFFQWNRLKKDHSYKEWGLFTSRDLLSWQFEGSALTPGQTYDRNGVYSGSGQVIGGRLCLFYTGNFKEDGRRISSQCLAVTEDGRQYCKEGVILRTPEEYTGHFRDPKVFRGKNSDYFMVIGGQRKNHKGAIALCRAEDVRNWEYQGTLAVSEQYEMIECPDLFELDGRWVLLYNPQKRSIDTDLPEPGFSAYKLGAFDEAAVRFDHPDLDTDFAKLDAGFDFYAPQTFETPDGRRLLLAWMSGMDGKQEAAFGKGEPNIHCLTIPRELSLRGGKLCQRPARELYTRLGRRVDAVWETTGVRGNPAGRAFFLKLKREDVNRCFQIILQGGEAAIWYAPDERRLVVSRRSWTANQEECREVRLERLEELEIWSDQSSMEIFVNGGETVLSARIFPGKEQAEIELLGIEENADIQICEIV
ncbi:MAG: sucrose-6-phosphate hydrolase [Lachnospiraceae bacterium]|nr:sucrose-6-phosphate hydrolase [Lachnospiraceae bacterium]